MPPVIALLLIVGFIVFLFRRDIQERPNVTAALWLPFLWMLLCCTRAISEWLSTFGLPLGGVSVEEGSPLDAGVYFALIIAGIYVLNKRQVTLAEIFRNNGWLMAFLLYCFIAITWSDFPLIAFKRWIKILGHPTMALIIFSEPDPEEALKRLMKRCAYIVLPISILFIKYYPQWGVRYSPWGGQDNNGIAMGKNMLGADCFILGLFLVWHLLTTWREPPGKGRRNELLLNAGLLCMVWWLLSTVHSSTSLGSLFVGASILLLVGMRAVNKRFIGTYILVGLVIFAAAETAFGISRFFIASLGRDPTLTGRTELWKQLLEFDTNPILGTGFESFWLGERLRKVGELYWWQANEAHSGYLETYLTLGLLGLSILIGIIIATFWKIRRELLRNFQWGRYRAAFLGAIVIYNYTEAAFKALHPVWFAFYLIAMEYPKVQFAPLEAPSEAAESEEERELIYAEDGPLMSEQVIGKLYRA
jgi:exopolysaccharide production protein ExoQ